MAGRRFAAIGVGSFELELGIYEIDAKYGIRNVDMLRHVIAIGSETYDTGRISYQTAQEITEVLSDFVNVGADPGPYGPGGKDHLQLGTALLKLQGPGSRRRRRIQ